MDELDIEHIDGLIKIAKMVTKKLIETVRLELKNVKLDENDMFAMLGFLTSEFTADTIRILNKSHDITIQRLIDIHIQTVKMALKEVENGIQTQ